MRNPEIFCSATGDGAFTQQVKAQQKPAEKQIPQSGLRMGWKLRRIEDRIGEPVIPLVQKLYVDQQLSLEGVAQVLSGRCDGEISVSTSAVRGWLNNGHTPRRPSGKEKFLGRGEEWEKRRIDGLRNMLRNPEKRKKWIEGIQSVTAKKNRAEGIKRSWIARRQRLEKEKAERGTGLKK